MDTCTNVPDMRRKEKQRVRSGTGRADATRRRKGMETRWSNSLSVGLFAVQTTSSTWGDSSAADDLHPPKGQRKGFLISPWNIEDERKLLKDDIFGTSRMCIHSLIGSSRRGTWNAAWRHSPCGCFRTQRGRWPSNRAVEGWPMGNHPREGEKQKWFKFYPVNNFKRNQQTE